MMAFSKLSSQHQDRMGVLAQQLANLLSKRDQEQHNLRATNSQRSKDHLEAREAETNTRLIPSKAQQLNSKMAMLRTRYRQALTIPLESY